MPLSRMKLGEPKANHPQSNQCEGRYNPDSRKVRNLKKYLGLIPVAIFAILLGCGGGGGGGSSSNGNTDTSTTGFTSGDTTAQAGDTILGQVVRGTVPVPNVTVRFFDVSNVQLSTAVTNVDGYFRAPLGTNARKVDVLASSLPSGLFVGFMYGSGIFQASSGGLECKVSLPTIVPGTLKNMTNGQFKFRLDTEPPLPPPTGCVP